MLQLTLSLATICTGLIAGLFFAFSVAVMPGLRRVDDAAFVGSMVAINRAIQNPLFALIFFGAFLFPALALLLDLSGPQVAALPLGLGFALYSVALGITFAVNIPLNAKLERGGGDHSLRRGFEARWVRWNTVRTVLCATAFLALVVSLTAAA
ncbi:putative membrane protein [Arthrobacter pigmenti]|uniref:Putative membrane protein n=1 Tax=Arthrobacter pigmenti TaxID=271432 RepID=A0A846RRI1_9MICC|nr:anthrone oxygenase family protein [Arthrobacter pigmenti]NJC24160.1 putative membrane protein [Arthrobacter pigmenti]